MKNMAFDGIGFISNIGYSKYWGVSINTDRNTYRLQINDPYNGNVTLNFDDDDVTEEEAASVAACIRYYRDNFGLPSALHVFAYGVRYRVYSDDGIIAVDYVFNDKPRHSNYVIFEDVFSNEYVENTKPKIEFTGSTNVIAQVYEWILNDEIDEQTSDLVIAMLNTIHSKNENQEIKSKSYTVQ
jgi:hypothetical protein